MEPFVYLYNIIYWFRRSLFSNLNFSFSYCLIYFWISGVNQNSSNASINSVITDDQVRKREMRLLKNRWAINKYDGLRNTTKICISDVIKILIKMYYVDISCYCLCDDWLVVTKYPKIIFFGEKIQNQQVIEWYQTIK